MYFQYLAIASMFRDSQEWHGRKINQVDRFFSQIYSQSIYGDIFCLEGNSQDNTLDRLNEYQIQLPEQIHVLNKTNKNNTKVQSVFDKHRIVNLSNIANYLLDIIYKLNKYDYILWIESDIIIKDNKLIEHLFDCFKQEKMCGLVAPRVFLETERFFYDVWGFSGPNSKIVQKPESFQHTKRFYDMNSIGTCGLFPASLQVNFGIDGFRELSRQVKKSEYNVYIDVQSTIYHPSSNGSVKNRLI